MAAGLAPGVMNTSTTDITRDRSTPPTAGSTSDGRSLGVVRSVDPVSGDVIDRERFTQTQDHEVVVERTTYLLEHRPVQKQWRMETRLVDEQRILGKPRDLLGVETRQVEETVVQTPGGEKQIIYEGVDLPRQGESTTSYITVPSTVGVLRHSNISSTRQRIAHLLGRPAQPPAGSIQPPRL